MDIPSFILGTKVAGGGSTPAGTIQITQNGTTDVTNYATADVNVQPNLESKSITITENKTTTITPDSGYDGLSSVEVITDVPGDIETQERLKDAINITGVGLTDDDPFTIYPNKLEEGLLDVYINGTDILYDGLPKVSATGTEMSLSPSVAGRLGSVIKGNTEEITYVSVGQIEQGSIDSISGANTSNSSYVRTKEYIPVEPNVLYSISRSVYNSYMQFRFYDENKNYLGSEAVSGMISSNREANDNRMHNGISNITMTILNTNVAYIRMVDRSNSLSTIYTIAKESTPSVSNPVVLRSATGIQQIDLKGGENYWHYSASGTGNGVNYNFNGSELAFNGRTSFAAAVYNGSNNKITVPAGTYKMSSKITGGSFSFGNNAFAIYIKNSNNQTIFEIVSSANFLSENIITFNEDTQLYVDTYANSSNMVFNNLKIEIQFQIPQSQTLNLGSTQLRKVNNNQDYITGTTDNWSIVRQIGNISSYAGETITTDYISSTGELTTGANVIYVLENETTETISDSTLISQLNNIYNLQSYNGETDILITSDNAPILMTASAIKGYE